MVQRSQRTILVLCQGFTVEFSGANRGLYLLHMADRTLRQVPRFLPPSLNVFYHPLECGQDLWT
jgi:hypothetical protein